MPDPAVSAAAEAAPLPSRSLAGVYAALIAQTLISAGTFLAAKQGLTELTPMELVMARFATSGLVFLALISLLPGRKLPPKEALVRIIFLGVLAGPINQGLFFFGLDRSNAAHAALFYALTPLGVYLYLLARKEEWTSRQKFLGISLAFSGVAILLLGRGLKAATGPLLGDLFILVAVAAWVLYTAEGRKLIDRYGALRATSWTMVVASAVGLPFAPLVVRPEHFVHASHLTWAMILYLGVMTSVVSYIFWYYALSRIEASRAAVFANLQPPATALAAWLLLDEKLTWEIFVGGALVIAGVRVTQSAPHPPPIATPRPDPSR